MRYLKNKHFQRELKDYGLDDEDIKTVIDDILEGRAMPLGFKMYKIRGAKEGKGKSGGFRNIFFWKKEELIVFCLLLAKNERDNFNSDEEKALRMWSKEYSELSVEEINSGIENKDFWRIEYVKKSQ